MHLPVAGRIEGIKLSDNREGWRTGVIELNSGVKELNLTVHDANLFELETFTPIVEQRLYQRKKRRRRGWENLTDPPALPCHLENLYYNFDPSTHPRQLNIRQCLGSCDKPMPLTSHNTHSYLQAKLSAKPGLGQEVGKPCCVPVSYNEEPIVVTNRDGYQIVLRNVIATKCGCR
eukprot:sb/3471998/